MARRVGICHDSKDWEWKEDPQRSGAHVCWGSEHSECYHMSSSHLGKAHLNIHFSNGKQGLRQLSQTCHRPSFGPRADSLLCRAQGAHSPFYYPHKKKETSGTGSEHLLWILLCKNDLELFCSHEHKSSEWDKTHTVTNVAGKSRLENTQPTSKGSSSCTSCQGPVECCAPLATNPTN